MLVLQVLKWLLLVAEICLAGPILYLCILSASAIRAAKKRNASNTNASSASASPLFDFAILIPAHNEEIILGNLLESLAKLEYPKDRYTLYLVADNCTDNTAELARATAGVRVYERFDESKRGKGYALNWLLQQLKEDHLSYDAYIILDADSVVEQNFLHAMSRELAQGGQAMQACNTVLNVTESSSTALRWLALTLMNHVRPLGRNGLGASSTLTGNGMCLSHILLMRYPWQAFSIAEDYQYYLMLVEHGERVRYVPEAIVRSQMPTTFAQMRTQDVRWELSSDGPRNGGIALKLLRAGIQSRDFTRIDAAAELLTPPLSFLVGSCLFLLVASVLLWFPLGLIFSLILIVGLISYISTALYLLHPPRTVYVALFYAPGFILWKLWVYFVLGRSKKHTREWVPTSRAVMK